MGTPKHRYPCRDRDCDNTLCQVYREAYRDGLRDGYREGYSDGYAAGKADAR